MKLGHVLSAIHSLMKCIANMYELVVDTSGRTVVETYHQYYD